MSEKELNTVEYEELLGNENPDYNFNISKTDVYKNGEGNIYEIDIHRPNSIEEYPSFSMIVGFFDFTKEEQEENFKAVTEITINAHNKQLEKEEAERLEEQKIKS